MSRATVSGRGRRSCVVTGTNGRRVRFLPGWVRSAAAREGAEAVVCAADSAWTARACRAALARRDAAAARRLAATARRVAAAARRFEAADARPAPAALAVTNLPAPPASALGAGCVAVGACTATFFLICAGAADRFACPGGETCA